MKNFIHLLIFFCVVFQGYTQDTVNRQDASGKKHGYWIRYDSAGAKIYEGLFIHGIPSGTFKYYYKNGALKTVSEMSSNGTRASTKTFFPDGKKMAIGNYINEKKDSLWQFFSDAMNAKTSEEFYKDGLLHGTRKIFYPSGPVAEIKHYVNGVEEGLWEKFFEDGKLQLRGNYHKGEKHGSFLVYSPDGTMLIKGQFKTGHQDGEWSYFDSQGKAVKKELYRMGELLKTVEFKEQ
jgi:antitoxin component YwqK of YwqJK toxin-antitoxin module